MLPGMFVLTKTRITVENATCVYTHGVACSSAANEVGRAFVGRPHTSRAIREATRASLHEGAS